MSVQDNQAVGELSLQTIAMPANTNWGGDIFGGWLVSQMDLAGAIHCDRVTTGRSATVAIQQMTFLQPVKIGDVVSCHTQIERVGRTSVTMHIEVWTHNTQRLDPFKAAEGTYIYVLLEKDGRKRQVPEHIKQVFAAS